MDTSQIMSQANWYSTYTSIYSTSHSHEQYGVGVCQKEATVALATFMFVGLNSESFCMAAVHLL